MNEPPNPIRLEPDKSPFHVVAIASGKGGVGKTNLVINMAIGLADLGKRVLVIDGDASLANADMLLDLPTRYDLADVLEGGRPIEDVLVRSPHGVTLLPAARGNLNLARLSDEQKLILLAELEALDDVYDVVLVDTATGIGQNSVFFASAAHDVSVVTTPEPTSMVDAYATVKALSRKAARPRIGLIVNQAANVFEADDVHKRLSHLCDRFLDVQLGKHGWLPFDARVHGAVMRRTPFLRYAPNAEVSDRVMAAARRIISDRRPTAGDRLQFFWRQLLVGLSPSGPKSSLRPSLLH